MNLSNWPGNTCPLVSLPNNFNVAAFKAVCFSRLIVVWQP